VQRGGLRRWTGSQVLAQSQPIPAGGLLQDESAELAEQRPQGGGCWEGSAARRVLQEAGEGREGQKR
jgi:hypothetical protein